MTDRAFLPRCLAAVTALTFSFSLGCATALADGPVAVSCDGFIPGYDGPGSKRQCVEADVSDGTETWRTRQILVADKDFFMRVNYIESGYKTYLPQKQLPEIVQDQGRFSATTDWQDPRSILGLDVAVFVGVLKGSNFAGLCGVFSRYSGDPGNQYDSSKGPAFKRHVFGYYCALPESLTADQRGEGFYAILQDVITKLRLPPAE
jgi:hypothetical protein